jgi:ABC-type amino acid transport substrate-binding protein
MKHFRVGFIILSICYAFCFASFAENTNPLISLTSEEISWIKNHPVVKIGIDPGFSPFEFFDESGRYNGMAADYVQLVSKALGIRFEPVRGLPWDKAVELAEKKEIDVLPCVGISEKRKRYFLFSKPYLMFPRVIVTRSENRIKSLKDRKSTRLNSSHRLTSRMPSSA